MRRHGRPGLAGARARLSAVGSGLVVVLLLACAAAVVGSLLDGGAAPPGAIELDLLGDVRYPTGMRFAGTEVGGLSAITYDAELDRYYVVSDDRGSFSAPRFYTLAIDLSAGKLTPDDVRFVAVTRLRDRRGRVLAEGSIDAEGLVLAPDRTLLLSSEGSVRHGMEHFVRRYSLDGRELGSFTLPGELLPGTGDDHGLRDDNALEGLALSADGSELLLGCEAPLLQDGEVPDLEHGGLARIVVIDLVRGGVAREVVYPLEPVPEAPDPPDAYRDNGLSELLALGDGTFLVLERAYSDGVGNTIRLYRIWLDEAADVSRFDGFRGLPPGEIRPVKKALVLDLADVGIEPDNLEGMTLGPRLADGRRSLVLVGDNNFNPDQETELTAFAIGRAPSRSRLAPRDVQGRGHLSSLAGERVRDLRGVVTAVVPGDDGLSFWIQDEGDDGDPATSEGVFITATAAGLHVAVGDVVELDGTVEETRWQRSLALTTIRLDRLRVVAHHHPLPEPVVLGRGGRPVPREVVDDDGLALFDPSHDAADFFESLEGMRVAVDDPLVVGPTTLFGELTILADGGVNAGLRSPRGGLILGPDGVGAERLVASSWLLSDPPQVTVGDRFAGRLSGVLHYGFGHYQLVITPPLPQLVGGRLEPETTELRSAPETLAVATFNVENLSAVSDPSRFAALARIVVERLGSPDLVALQEVQDDSGPEDDGVVSAEQTMQLLVAAIAAAGGPAYAVRQLDPLDGGDGGQPGGNIRVALLLDPRRVTVVDRSSGDELAAVTVVEGPHLEPSPGRVGPRHPAFRGHPERYIGGSRKPLAVELEVAGRPLFVVVCHLTSKFVDDPVFGFHQPPRRTSEALRREQALVINGLVRRLLARDPEARVVVLGDMNELEERPPMVALAGDELEDLILRLPPEERYTYVYNGGSQVLDHVFVSRSIVEGAEIDVVHVDAEYPADARASDHDPVVARLSVGG